MASTTLFNGKETHTRWCIPQKNLEPVGQPIYCRDTEGLVNNHCCYTDYCNSIDLKLPSGNSWETSHCLYSMIIFIDLLLLQTWTIVLFLLFLVCVCLYD